MDIGIVGLGLIGGSLGLDLRACGHRVLGNSRRQETCQLAVARGIVDLADVDLTLMAAAEVVFICTPLSVIVPTVEQLIPHLQPAAVLTDVGSVKTPVVQALTPLWPNFVGGHPMAGKAESGIEVAQSSLFAGRPYVTTPVASTPPAALEAVEDLARSLGARLYRCSPEDHDRAVAWISHLPVTVSASLISACTGEPDPAVLSLAKQLASTGFRDTSRVGGGNPELGLLMAKYNRRELLRALHAYRGQLDQFISHIEREDWSALEQHLTQTHQARPDFLEFDS
ncbi:MAG: prephenate/arogenate dehydrogenase [Oscillatoria sp. Prado101]|jgi:arogenate dehydrogenase (NADP+)|nr:prephenate/arogenate dehydrogenase [Oscillatoria sp. Prado101]